MESSHNDRRGEPQAVLPGTAQAVAASIACAKALGLPHDDPEVIAEGFSVRVRLRPAPVVTRVVTTGRELRPEPMPWLEREVSVVQHLVASAVPVVAPWDDPGPYVAEGLEVSLWQYVRHDSAQVTGAEFGAMLGPLHEALASYTGDLPPLVGPLTDIRTALRVSTDPTLQRSAAQLIPLALSWPRRPLHGDAHTGNVLVTHGGPLWTDFEDVCVGPIEWDLASMTLADDALSAYAGPIDQARLAECRDLRRLQILASLMVGRYDEPELHRTLVTHLNQRYV